VGVAQNVPDAAPCGSPSCIKSEIEARVVAVRPPLRRQHLNAGFASNARSISNIPGEQEGNHGTK
jgi:hypothetical protein